MAFQSMEPIGSLLVGLSAHAAGAPFTVLLDGAVGMASALLFIPVLKKARIEAERRAA